MQFIDHTSTQDIIGNGMQQFHSQKNLVVVTIQMFAVILVQVFVHVVFLVGNPLNRLHGITFASFVLFAA